MHGLNAPFGPKLNLIFYLRNRVPRLIVFQGALVAALGDLSFNTLGYIVIFFNDLFTALNGVILKRTSEGEAENRIMG